MNSIPTCGLIVLFISLALFKKIIASVEDLQLENKLSTESQAEQYILEHFPLS